MVLHLDPRSYPHIVAMILSSADYASLLNARLASYAMRQLADRELERGSLLLRVKAAHLAMFTDLRDGQRRIVPGSSIDASAETRTRIMRNATQVHLQAIDEGLIPEANRLMDTFAYVEYIYVHDGRRPPFVDLRLPVTSSLHLIAAAACNGLPWEERTGHFTHRATHIDLTVEGRECVGADCPVHRVPHRAKFYLDMVVNPGVRHITLRGRDALDVVQHFWAPFRLRSPGLRVSIDIGRGYHWRRLARLGFALVRYSREPSLSVQSHDGRRSRAASGRRSFPAPTELVRRMGECV